MVRINANKNMAFKAFKKSLNFTLLIPKPFRVLNVYQLIIN